MFTFIWKADVRVCVCMCVHIHTHICLWCATSSLLKFLQQTGQGQVKLWAQNLSQVSHIGERDPLQPSLLSPQVHIHGKLPWKSDPGLEFKHSGMRWESQVMLQLLHQMDTPSKIIPPRDLYSIMKNHAHVSKCFAVFINCWRCPCL